MAYEFVQGNFKSVLNEWTDIQSKASSNLIFSTPEWTRTWWQHFNKGNKEYIGVIKAGTKTVGIAPLMLQDNSASFIGGTDVCDYLDFIILPGHEDNFFRVLINNLISNHIQRLDLQPLRPESTVMTSLINLCQNSGLSISVNKIDVSPYLDLPESWEQYLLLLNRKQRHELKRKMRRLGEIGEITYRSCDTATKENTDSFLELFRSSRSDKAHFLNPQREEFFRSIFTTMSKSGFFRLNLLELNSALIAATICFDFNHQRLLYNSGFDRKFGWLSVGLLSKALCIKECIQQGYKKFDFLKGNEEYKYHLGGRETTLYRCVIMLNNRIH